MLLLNVGRDAALNPRVSGSLQIFGDLYYILKLPGTGTLLVLKLLVRVGWFLNIRGIERKRCNSWCSQSAVPSSKIVVVRQCILLNFIIFFVDQHF